MFYRMSSVYILYSQSADKYYVGSTKDLVQRLDYHQNKEFRTSFTAKYPDWEVFYLIETEDITVARKIESHIKKMKSRIYLQNLILYPEISSQLISKYSLKSNK